ncbi:hypothetical protein [Salegentibacter flavus]|uniref:PD-(D/E)XK nuclease superfamily protein n=1 Tax=Salegentibacter flavus TaxID=287099 RepID=A0A1I4ZU24_9FLAO|nr:hypothetical protein [Salegentibacter flavus]SFN53742.1 hypothetical protein SAMN05660413_01523 [Salegentibacter flavus]
MIYAVKHNKVDRNQFKLNEDSLTSSVFERLRYLPKEMFHHILEKALYDTIPGLDLTSMESVEYWPNWSAEETSNSNHVQPDVFIRTRKSDIIIETKRYDIKQQDPFQWKNQVIAYHTEYGEEKELIYIALGGLNSNKTEPVLHDYYTTKIYKCKWRRILHVVKEVLYRLESSYDLTYNHTAIHNILSDIVLSFGMYGFFTGEWLERFIKPESISISNLNRMQDINNISEWKN